MEIVPKYINKYLLAITVCLLPIIVFFTLSDYSKIDASELFARANVITETNKSSGIRDVIFYFEANITKEKFDELLRFKKILYTRVDSNNVIGSTELGYLKKYKNTEIYRNRVYTYPRFEYILYNPDTGKIIVHRES